MIATIPQNPPALMPDISSEQLGKLLAAIRNDPPNFSDHLETQKVAESIWRKALDTVGAALLDLQREGVQS